MILTFIILALANAAISLTIAESNLFSGLRLSLARWDWIHSLVSCAYCMSHWVAFAMVIIWKPFFTNCGFIILDLGVSAFAMVMLSALFYGLYFKLTQIRM